MQNNQKDKPARGNSLLTTRSMELESILHSSRQTKITTIKCQNNYTDLMDSCDLVQHVYSKISCLILKICFPTNEHVEFPCVHSFLEPLWNLAPVKI